MTREQSLWLAVIKEAFFDAQRPDKVNRGGNLVENPFHMDIRKARDWLASNSRGFQDVCFLAGLNPEWVIDKYKSILTSLISNRDKQRFSDGTFDTD